MFCKIVQMCDFDSVFYGLGSSEYGYCCFLWPGYDIKLRNEPQGSSLRAIFTVWQLGQHCSSYSEIRLCCRCWAHQAKIRDGSGFMFLQVHLQTVTMSSGIWSVPTLGKGLFTCTLLVVFLKYQKGKGYSSFIFNTRLFQKFSSSQSHSRTPPLEAQYPGTTWNWHLRTFPSQLSRVRETQQQRRTGTIYQSLILGTRPLLRGEAGGGEQVAGEGLQLMGTLHRQPEAALRRDGQALPQHLRPDPPQHDQGRGELLVHLLSTVC